MSCCMKRHHYCGRCLSRLVFGCYRPVAYDEHLMQWLISMYLLVQVNLYPLDCFLVLMNWRQPTGMWTTSLAWSTTWTLFLSTKKIDGILSSRKSQYLGYKRRHHDPRKSAQNLSIERGNWLPCDILYGLRSLGFNSGTDNFWLVSGNCWLLYQLYHGFVFGVVAAVSCRDEEDDWVALLRMIYQLVS